MSESIAYIKVNDIFDDLTNENKKLSQCLNVLIKFKSFIDLVSNKLRDNLETDVIERFDGILKEVEDVIRLNKMDFSGNEDSNGFENSIENIDFESKHSKSNDKDYKPNIKKRRPLKLGSNRNKTNKYEIEYRLDDDQKYICPHIGCGSRLKNKATLRDHYKLHLGTPKPFKCDVDGCGFSFAKRLEFIDHTNAHKGIKPFKCDLCDKCLSSKKQLRKHLKLHSGPPKRYVCDFDDCGKKFNIEDNLKKHQITHLDYSQRTCVCTHPNCDYRAIDSKQLDKHMKRHSNERPFACPLNCGKYFREKKQIKYHLETHITERNFVCTHEGCGKSFKTANNRNNHQMTHNEKTKQCDWPGCEYATNVTNKLNLHKRLIHSQQRDHKCVWPNCDKAFKSANTLTMHMRRHTGDKRYPCVWPGCPMKFIDSNALKRHTQRMHKVV